MSNHVVLAAVTVIKGERRRERKYKKTQNKFFGYKYNIKFLSSCGLYHKVLRIIQYKPYVIGKW
jgi:hypothetical protein